MEGSFLDNEYVVVSRKTGQEFELDVFLSEIDINFFLSMVDVESLPSTSRGWEKVYPDELVKYISCSGAKGKLLSWLISSRETGNFVYGTQSEIGKEAGVSMTVVKSVFKDLQDKKIIAKVRSGMYMINPNFIRNGCKVKGAVMLNKWDEVK